MAAETDRIDPVDPVDGQTLRPSPARIHNYLLGGKDHYGHDRQACAALCALAPCLITSARAGRRFMIRVARQVAGVHRVEQVLDVGSGIPSSPNVHDVVQRERPAARVVYVDHDPVVVAQARALVTPPPPGVVRCFQGDLRRPHEILGSAVVQETLDLRRPVAVLVLAVLDTVLDDDEARDVVARLLDPWPPGSLVAISAACSDGAPAQARAVERFGEEHDLPSRFRSGAGIVELFGGLELLPPGVVPVHRWWPEPVDLQLRDDEVMLAGGVAVKR
jgi:hypothetical protein